MPNRPLNTIVAGDNVSLGSFEPPRVLVVDDNPANLAVFEAILADPGFELVSAQSGVEAMRHLLNADFAAILLDMNMPTMDGIQTAQLIRERERSRDVPIIFITAYQPDQKQILAGYASGAVDYLVKPVSPDILKSKVRIFVDLFRKTRQIEWQARQLRATNARLQREVAQREEAQRDAAFEREERQRVTLASIADAVITTDKRGLVTSLNPVAEQLTGWRSAQAKGHPLAQVLNIASSEGESSAERSLQQALGGDEMVRDNRSYALEYEGGTRYVDLSVSPVHDRVGTVIGAVMILHDITARHEIEVERSRALRFEQDARRAAEQSGRARDEFLAVISHELRTPLNAIVGWTHVLRTSGSNQAYAEQAVDAIHRSAMAQKKLIEDLLDMSRIINGKIDLQRQWVDLSAVVAAAVDTLRPGADEKRVRLNCNLEPLAREALADRARIQQVVWNVVSNAIKFTPSGGEVNVRLDAQDEYARISVTDTGQGVAAEFLPHMFESFRQADSSITRKQGGLGLGLAISKQLIEAHGGEIQAHSEGENRGTTITLKLPLQTHEVVQSGTDRDSAHAANQDLVAVDRPLSGVRVLVVDDDFNTLTLVGIALREQGALVRAVSSAAEAMRTLEEWSPKALLSDISMPDEDGYSLIRRVRATPQGANIAAMALTAMASEEDRLRALNAGFDAHVPKPLDLTALVHAVSMQLGNPAAKMNNS